jgi:hypothetical protein
MFPVKSSIVGASKVGWDGVIVRSLTFNYLSAVLSIIILRSQSLELASSSATIPILE